MLDSGCRGVQLWVHVKVMRPQPGNRLDRLAKPGEDINVCISTHDKSKSNRLERRTALIAWKLARDKVNIAAFDETRFSEEGWVLATPSGAVAPKAERRDVGDTLAIRNGIVGRLPCLPQGIDDRLMNLRLPPRGIKFATTISRYASTMTGSDEANSKF
ncbi:hypothetical protein SprV_0200924100 [Sparganum proliferum]